MKIVSLVPSLTEALFDLGLTHHEVIGRTKFCIHPKKSIKEVSIIGGTKNPNIEKIIQLKPDLIIANKEENNKPDIEILKNYSQVWITDIKNIDDNITFLYVAGKKFNREIKANEFIEKIQHTFVNTILPKQTKTLYLIWNQPYMSIGSDTFIHSVLSRLGFDNVCKNSMRYPEITHDELQQTENIFLSSEPYPFKEKHVLELQKKFPDKKIILVDGEAFSWYGTRVGKQKDYFIDLIETVNKKDSID